MAYLALNVSRISNSAIDAIIAEFVKVSDASIEMCSQNINAYLANNIETLTFSETQRELIDEINATKASINYTTSEVERNWAQCLADTLQMTVATKINGLYCVLASLDDASTHLLDIYIKCDRYLMRPDLTPTGEAKINEYKNHLTARRLQYKCIEGEIKVMIEWMSQYHKSLTI